MKIVKRENRLRPRLITPGKGEPGDCTDETMVGMCDINRIIQRYGGNLAELAAWRGTMQFGEQPPDNLEEALEMLNNAKDICKNLGVDSVIDAITKLTEIPTEIPEKPITESEVNNETPENKPENVEANISENGK